MDAHYFQELQTTKQDALDELERLRGELAICEAIVECRAKYDPKWGAPVAPAEKRRGRPPGSKTRKVKPVAEVQAEQGAEHDGTAAVR